MTLVLLALLAGGGVALPLVEAVEDGRARVALDTGHDPSLCLPFHDHGLCAQYQHGRLPAGSPAALPATPWLRWTWSASGETPLRASPSRTPSLPRAPPLS
ncbi:MAG: hypothetical protein HY561_05900 [Gemmatimonadetes bacterium]|nr:hypothetical protein [Gemmatimonadota bacterium]